MRKDWLKDIHDRMTDFEVDAPQGLWDDICAAESKAKGTPLRSNQKRDYRIWIGSSAAAAACLLFLWFIRPDIEQVTEETTLPTQNIASTDHRPSIEEQVLLEETGHAEQPIIASVTSNKKSTKSIQKLAVVNNGTKTDEQVTDNAEVPNSTDNIKPSDGVKQSDCNLHSESKKEENLKRYEYFAQSNLKRHDIDHRLSVGLSSSGGIGSDSHQLLQGGQVAASSMLSESEWVDSPLLGILALNRGAETERKVSHHAPIRTQLLFSYRLNDRWSIESGLSYAYTSTEIQEGSASHFIDEEQKLHYIGIPLGATYRFFSWRRLDLYLSSNVLAEQCVYGQSRKKFIVGNKVQEDEDTSAIHSRPMQWSVGAELGLQYNLNSLLSVYAEPGCSYYFDDHSSLETVFKEKKLDFTLNLGLRFMVGSSKR